MINLEKEIADYQVELFQMLAEFFGRATGTPPREFATVEGFGDEVRRRAETIGRKSEDAFLWADTEFRQFYAMKGPTIAGLAARLGGLKLVLGGSSRFLGSQFAAVKGALLYADTVLIPDPLFPWLETERKEEKFRHVHMLQAAHALLHLKSVVDSDLPHCPILVFPSYEKLLEENDPTTKTGISKLLIDVVKEYVEPSVETEDDIRKLAKDNSSKFLNAVEKSKLLVAPGGVIGSSVADSLVAYLEHAKTWRSNEWVKDYQVLSDSGKVLKALLERLTPQYHLLENSEELRAHPLLCIDQQAYYFKLISSLNSRRLEKLDLLDKETNAMLAGFGSERLAWMSNLSTDALIDIRKRNENESFRTLMKSSITDLHNATLQDTDRVSAEMCLAIDSGIGLHNNFLADIDSKYRNDLLKTTGAAAAAGVAALVPSLAPYLIATAPLALVGKLAWDTWDRSVEKDKKSRSLMGVLAIARTTDQ